jgi:hypothetical protein
LREGRADGVPLLLRKLPENLVHAAEPEPALSFDPFAENAENTEIDETGPGADTPKPLDHVFLAGVGHRKRRGRGERERRA